MDAERLDFSVVAPYAVNWVLEMEDLRLDPNMPPVYETRTITNPEGSWSTEVVTVTWVEVSADRKTITQTWESGFMVISSSHGYTESHVVHVVAFDAAGNETESEPVRFNVIHEPEEEEEETATIGPMGGYDAHPVGSSWPWVRTIARSRFALPPVRPAPWWEFG